MAKITIDSIDRTDVPETGWAPKLLDSLNQFMLNVAKAFSNGITFQGNCTAQVDTLPANYTSTSPWPKSIRWRFPGVNPAGCIIVQAEPTFGGTDGISGALMPEWRYTNGEIVIIGIRGTIATGNTYNFTFLTFA